MPDLNFRKHHSDKPRRQLIAAVTIVVAAGLYAKHRKVVNAAINAQQDLAFESMWSSFDEGVKYGLALAQEGVKDVKDAGQYAFSAFDRSA